MAARIGICGTFDVENFGDLLFPLLARHELEARLGAVELLRFSYRRKSASDWPFDVLPLQELPGLVGDLDLVIVGGGDLVRFDKAVAPGYEPTAGWLHHPTAYWLLPTQLAPAHGVPVAWNAVGVIAVPDWARGLVAEAAATAARLAVRDEHSRGVLLDVDPALEPVVVPDTAFGVARIVSDAQARGAAHLLERTGVNGPYVVVQPSPYVVAHAERIARLVDHAAQEGRAALELPISPILGDEPGLLGDGVPLARLGEWPPPAELAAIVAGADAVLAQSLHLSITAAALGVPVHRFSAWEGSKYARLASLEGVHLLPVDGDEPVRFAELGRRMPDTGAQAELDAHWDAVARLAGTSARPRPELAARAFSGWVSALEPA